MKNLTLVLKIIISIILLQTLYFKFTTAEESVYIFSTLGAEPAGRIGSGIMELVACLFLFSKKYDVYAAGLSLLTMSGAMVSHLLILGIEVKGDGGLLFALATLVWVASFVVILLNRHKLPIAIFKKEESK